MKKILVIENIKHAKGGFEIEYDEYEKHVGVTEESITPTIRKTKNLGAFVKMLEAEVANGTTIQSESKMVNNLVRAYESKHVK